MKVQELINQYKKYLDFEYNQYLADYVNTLEQIEDKNREIKNYSISIEQNLIIHVFLLEASNL